MLDLCRLIIGFLVDLFRPRAAMEAEILVFCQQIIVLQRGRPGRVAFLSVDSMVLGWVWECLDHLIVFGEAHLRRILGEYAAYYNCLRTHRALNQDTPVHRSAQTIGAIKSRPVLGGLHHQYCRI